jgi:hypothetical protein
MQYLNPPRAKKIQPTILSFLSSVTILPFTTAEAEKAAEIRAILKSQGQPIGAYDVLIAGHGIIGHGIIGQGIIGHGPALSLRVIMFVGKRLAQVLRSI